MHCEIMMIGTELLLGQIVDTNAAFMGLALAENGINLYQKTTVGDNAVRIRAAFDAALDRSDVILTSGGLGPTEDDITRECIAELLGRPLEFRQDLYDDLVECFARFRFKMTENNKKQACAPRGAVGIKNPNGTAPGLIVEDARGIIVCMPGVPRELKPMLTDSVIPYLRRKFGLSGVIHSRVLKVCGIGESRVDAAMGDLIVSQQNPTVGVLASPDAVRIRITARAADVDAAEALIAPVADEIGRRLSGLIMGGEQDTLESVVDALIAGRGWRLAVVEADTGGTIAQRFAAAHSRCFAGGLVLASATLPALIDGEMLRKHARDARERFSADCALVVFPDASGRQSSVLFETPTDTVQWDLTFRGANERAQVRATVLALEYVRRHLLGVPVDLPHARR